MSYPAVLQRLRLPQLSIAQMTFCLTLYYVLILNLPLFREFYSILSAADAVKTGFVISIPFFIFAVIYLVFNLAVWPYITKPLFSLILITSSMVSYSMYNYGIYIDYGMVENIFETDTAEASAYVSLYSACWVLLLGILPALLLISTRRRKQTILSLLLEKCLGIATAVGIILVIFWLYYQDYSSVGRNNHYLKKMIVPTEYIYSTANYVNQTYLTEPVSHTQIGTDAQQKPAATRSEKPTLMVFVLGETARAQNYELNGYPRATNRYTRDMNVISFQDVTSCGTATALSVPCMFSNLNREDYDKQIAANQDNLLDILQRAGIDILWKENDGGDKGVADRVKSEVIERGSSHPLCNGKTCYDMALLDNFSNNVSSLKNNRLIALHLIGSHGPTYYQRYPAEFKAFTPDCPRSDIENCEISEIVNTYDNTLLYTDYVISQTIEKLKALESEYNTALFYISDHGESLGENGVFLHGIPYLLAPETQKKVPLITWFSDGFLRQKNLSTDCLKKQAQSGSYSHDNVFHSMLGIMDVTTSVYTPSLDLFAECRQ
ncbi:phosphoethanolamine transferase [Aliamphritea hakodatensis]|uniref:phosphoethanolamine transferase n=1 Tax=Aliamphritea hakodatensis TaxID=2895352 RepID=UPI0022FD718E|nr:phosphoethanolamine--lipid A transferase [Aliamphritea hakodatensis]